MRQYLVSTRLCSMYGSCDPCLGFIAVYFMLEACARYEKMLRWRKQALSTWASQFATSFSYASIPGEYPLKPSRSFQASQPYRLQ